MEQRIVLTTAGSGNNGKTSALIAIAYMLRRRGYPVCMVSFDPEPENNLLKLIDRESFGKQGSRSLTITDLLKKVDADDADITEAVAEATFMMPAGFGVIRCDVALTNYESEGGDIYSLMRLIPHLPDGFILIDCAAGSGGFSMLAALAASNYVVGVTEPSEKSISIARRVCGFDIAPGEEETLLDQLTGIDEPTGLEYGPKYAGLIGNKFMGARWEDDQIVIAQSGVSTNLRGYMQKIIDTPGFLDFVPFRTGADQRDVVRAYERITDKLLSQVLS